MLALLKRIALCSSQIQEYEQRIAQLYDQQEDMPLFASLPATGPTLGPRLLVAFGTERSRFQDAAAFQRYTGVAPVTKQSGNTRIVYRRFACRKFLRQSLIEWAGQTIPKSTWARAYYQQQKAKGRSHHVILRSLAYKWIRIIFRCWQDRIPYDESRYIQALIRSGSSLAATLKNT